MIPGSDPPGIQGQRHDLGFNFPFDGDMYDSISIGSNGGIMLGNGGDATPPAPPPGPIAREVLGKYGGCTVGVSDGRVDPTLPLLILFSIVGLLTRRKF